MRRYTGLISLVLSLGAVTIFLALILLSSSCKEVRYHRSNVYSALYDAVFEQFGPIDIAFGGSSRVRRAVYAPFLAKSLTPFFGKKPIIYDLGVPGKGSDAQVRVLLDLLVKREVKFVFFQIDRALDRKIPTHGDLEKIGKLHDILRAPIKNYSLGVSVTHRCQLLYKRISATLDVLLTDPFICKREVFPKPAESTDVSPPRWMNIQRQLKILKERKEKRNGKYFKQKKRKWRYEKGNNQRSDYYIDLLLKKARSKETIVAFIDLPRFEGNTLDRGFPEYVKKRFNVDYLYLNQNELLDLGKFGYGDPGHVNIRGEKIIRNMIVRYFESHNVLTKP